MCSIIGSHNVDTVKKLAELNAYRGQHSHSVCVIDDGKIQYLSKGFGALAPEMLDGLPQGYIICHQQAPTTDAKDENSIHPASYKGSYLWHNGIVKANQIKKWQDEWKDNQPWDTAWLLNFLVRGDYSFLSEVDGTFACAYYHPYSGLNIFRNANCPLFVHGSTISSTRFDDAKLLPDGEIFQLQTSAKWTKINISFKTKEQFYWSAV
jgi:asparagine synthetase B (glutamine-hydrolysing)|tara:strand:+ start:8155 stop:8778 length:624 start_codon:yes stop_codon:yes gene_type:complete